MMTKRKESKAAEAGKQLKQWASQLGGTTKVCRVGTGRWVYFTLSGKGAGELADFINTNAAFSACESFGHNGAWDVRDEGGRLFDAKAGKQ